jgi:hypothetical protein
MMKLRVVLFSVFLSIAITRPVSAQIYWQAPDFAGAPVVPGEPGIGVAMPGATPEELRASVAWQLRSGLNVMALQCQFDRTLLTEVNYNTVLTNHKGELETAYAKIAAYFKRINKTPKAGQDALDRYGTKTYLSMSTVRGQLGFCQTAANIAQSVIYTPRGSFTVVAIERLREMRNSLLLAGEQQFRFGTPRIAGGMPNFDKRCWKRDTYKSACGLT